MRFEFTVQTALRSFYCNGIFQFPKIAHRPGQPANRRTAWTFAYELECKPYSLFTVPLVTPYRLYCIDSQKFHRQKQYSFCSDNLNNMKHYMWYPQCTSNAVSYRALTGKHASIHVHALVTIRATLCVHVLYMYMYVDCAVEIVIYT